MKNLISLFSLCAIGILLISASSQAEEAITTTATTELKTSASELQKNKKFEEDRSITDSKMRAEAGSLSKYSLKFNLSYFGPPVGDLTAKDQPNPDGGLAPSQTALSGSVGLRYRTASDRSFSMGTGLKAIHPLHGMERFDVNNPFLNYDMTYRTSNGIQMRNSPGISYVTIPEFTRVGEVAALSYDFSSVYNLPSSRLAVGMDVNVGYYVYNRNYEPSDKNPSRASLAVYPTLKYNFSDRLNVATSTALSWLSPRSASNESTLLNKTINQRIGVGYAFTRDIYLYPYVTVYPTRMAWDTTTMNLSTTFSIL